MEYSFALGQIFYKDFAKRNNISKDREIFVLLFFGGLLITFLGGWFFSVINNNYYIFSRQENIIIFLFDLFKSIYFYFKYEILQNIISINFDQFCALLYLGFISSGLCFFMWNKGARQVRNSTLAAFNNLKIPLSVFVSIIIFQEKANLFKVTLVLLIVIFSLLYLEKIDQNKY
ncbi:MAG TPA: EamA family transporter [Candidatus Megaira endosymbiont of Hartmannula sinica]|nr:EamA family transporter [Candidatus Megaera endosymbiont of Hartmannula sinica]